MLRHTLSVLSATTAGILYTWPVIVMVGILAYMRHARPHNDVSWEDWCILALGLSLGFFWGARSCTLWINDEAREMERQMGVLVSVGEEDGSPLLPLHPSQKTPTMHNRQRSNGHHG